MTIEAIKESFTIVSEKIKLRLSFIYFCSIEGIF